MRSTERLICLLESVNGTAINNDVEAGRGVGDHIAELCREAAARLREHEEASLARVRTVAQEYLENPLDLIEDAIGHHDGDHGC